VKYEIQERLDWRRWVTPVGLKEKPVHRWCVFPHSFTDELVSALIEEWGLTLKDKILDPFAGAGTTILAAKRRGVPATGYDLSPFAVHAARAKTANYNLERLEKSRNSLIKSLKPEKWNGTSREYSQLVKDALPGRLLGAFNSIDDSIKRLECTETEQRFFRLALLRTIPKYSRAVPTGGWLSWVDNRRKSHSLKRSFEQQLNLMLSDLRAVELSHGPYWQVKRADARRLPDQTRKYTAVITSPPYPNRHDYTRVFGVELMFGFLDWEGTRQLRYQSFESHPEAHPNRPEAPDYQKPRRLTRALSAIKPKDKDERITRLLSGYFLDMYLSLREVKRVCRKGARLAYVVGNAQYFGVPVLVDELTAEVGEEVGLGCEKIIVARYRGNSAQQMGKFGRCPSRESIIVFRNHRTA
jgi:tRNA G10  N-methylase Trm11